MVQNFYQTVGVTKNNPIRHLKGLNAGSIYDEELQLFRLSKASCVFVSIRAARLVNPARLEKFWQAIPTSSISR